MDSSYHDYLINILYLNNEKSRIIQKDRLSSRIRNKIIFIKKADRFRFLYVYDYKLYLISDLVKISKEDYWNWRVGNVVMIVFISIIYSKINENSRRVEKFL